MANRRSRGGGPKTAVLLLLALLLQLPFLGQAFHIDDNIYLMVAENWAHRPWAPQDLSAFFEGLRVESFISHEHPLLLSSVLLRPVFLVPPQSMETAAHGVFLLFYLLLVFSAFRLAQQMTSWAFFGALLTALSPAVFVSSHTVMLDLPYTALLYAALAQAVGQRRRRLRIWTAGTACAGAVMLAYQAAFFVPVIGWGFGREAKTTDNAGNIARRLIGLARTIPGPVWALPACALFLYGLVYSCYFQRFIWFDLAAFWTSQPESGGGAVGKLAHFALAFFGCLLFPLAWTLWTRRDSVGSPALRSKTGRLLLAMIGINAALAALVFQVGAVRYWLPAAPAVCLLTAARLGELPWRHRWRRAFAALLLSLTVGLSWGLALADREWADFYRQAAKESAGFAQDEERIWFTAEWGFRWYLRRAGAETLGRADARPQPGDLLVRPRIASPYRTLYDVDPRTLRLERIIEYRPSLPLRLLDFDSMAGFYSSGWGLLPFSLNLSSEPLERIAVYRVVRGVESPPDEPTYWDWNRAEN